MGLRLKKKTESHGEVSILAAGAMGRTKRSKNVQGSLSATDTDYGREFQVN
jgi:hypothetical protein